MTRWMWSIGTTWLVLLAGGLSRGLAAEEEAVFPMEEVSVLELKNQPELLRGQHAGCQAEPYSQVKKYPELHSAHPWYGELVLGRNPEVPESGTTYYFVLDESGTKPEAKEAKKDETPAASLLGKINAALAGAVEKSPEEPAERKTITYDRLYLDLNRDLDLTNDGVLERQTNPPAGAAVDYSLQPAVFPELTLEFDWGGDCGVRPVRVLPRLMIQEYQGKPYGSLLFLATTVRRGTIRLGAREFLATLGQPYAITGRYNIDGAFLRLTDTEGKQRERWWGCDTVGAVRRVENRWYTTSTTVAGDQITVRPYQGEFGIFRVGAGKRTFDKVGSAGSLSSKESSVPVGEFAENDDWPKDVAECQLPVGDYLPLLLNVHYGPLTVEISNNYHSDGKPRTFDRNRMVYGLPIRPDKPCVLDFSNPPEVLFASPAREAVVHPGEEVTVKAVLIDPVLDVMIRELRDSRVTRKKTVNEGTEHQFTTDDNSLDPTVVITDSAGKTVAEGTLPFG